MNRKLLFVFMSCLLIVALVGCSAPAPKAPAEEGGEEEKPAEQVFINIASGGTAGTYFPLAGGMADIWNKNIPGVNATAQSTGASVANINLLRDGEADVIMVQNDIAYYAANGTEMFEGDAYPALRDSASCIPKPYR